MGREFILPPRIITGKDSLALAEKEFLALGQRALIVTGPNVKKLDCFKKLTELLSKIGVAYRIYSEVTGEPDDVIVLNGLIKYRLEKCMSFALDGAYERFADLGRAVGAAEKQDSDKDAAEKFLAKLGDICRICEVPSLENYGIHKTEFLSQIDKMADDALASGSPANTIKSITKDNIIGIYRSLWDQ